LIKFVATSTCFVIALFFRSFGATAKFLTVDQSPRDAVTRSFGMAEIVAAKTFIEILTRSHIATPCFAAAQNVNVKHGE
jgi:hypothetical protein